MSHTDRPLVVLHAGALDSIHLGRWVGLTRDAGHVALVAGHLRPGLAAAALPGDVGAPRRSPQLPWASTRRAAQTGSGAHRLAAALPNGLVEVPLCAAWLRRLAGRLRPDVVHAHWLPHWGAAAALAGVRPLVVGAMGSDVAGLDPTRRRLADLALSRADRVIAPSPHAQALLAESARGRCLHLETGVDLEAFRPPTADQRAQARRELGLGDEPTVLSPRAPTALYGLEIVAQAFARLRSALPRARLLVAPGPLPLDRHTRDQLDRLGSAARVLGNVPAEGMARFLQAADVTVSMPASDASPASVWESLACATPVVCSRLEAIVERVGPGNGLIAVPREAGALAQALEQLLTRPDHAAGLGRAGRLWAQAHVDRGARCAELDGLYRELAAPARFTGRASGSAASRPGGPRAGPPVAPIGRAAAARPTGPTVSSTASASAGAPPAGPVAQGGAHETPAPA